MIPWWDHYRISIQCVGLNLSVRVHLDPIILDSTNLNAGILIAIATGSQPSGNGTSSRRRMGHRGGHGNFLETPRK